MNINQIRLVELFNTFLSLCDSMEMEHYYFNVGLHEDFLEVYIAEEGDLYHFLGGSIGAECYEYKDIENYLLQVKSKMVELGID